VLIYDCFETKKVYFSLRGHETRVNAVEWLSKDEIISVSDKIIVHKGSSLDGSKWAQVQTIGLGNQINYMSTLSTQKASYICVISDDGNLRLYERTDGDFKVKAELMFGRNLQEAVCLTMIGQNHLLLLLGGYQSQIHAYTLQ
jgi:WD40 repeat protein